MEPALSGSPPKSTNLFFKVLAAQGCPNFRDTPPAALPECSCVLLSCGFSVGGCDPSPHLREDTWCLACHQPYWGGPSLVHGLLGDF